MSRTSLLSTLPRLVALAGLLAVAGCDSGGSDRPFDVDDYTGTYNGTVLTVFSNGTSNTETSATAVVTIVKGTGNTVTVTIDAGAPETGGDDPAPVVFPGTYDDSGARFVVATGTNSFAITVDGDGEIDGGGSARLFDLGLDLDPEGEITSDRFLLTVNVEVTDGNDDVPTGSEGRFSVSAFR